MTELSPPLAEFLASAIPYEAEFVHRRYTFLPAEDIEQEMWAGALEKRDTLEKLLEEGQEYFVRQRLRGAAWKAVRDDNRYRRTVKALASGYRPEDEQFYTPGLLRQLVPLYLDNGVTERPPQGHEMAGRVSGGGGTGDYMAMMLDVAWAFSEIPEYHRRILERYYVYPQGSRGWKHAEIASALGINPETLRHRRDRAIRALRSKLGGRNPWNRRALEYEASKAS